MHRDLKLENILLVQPRNHSGIYDGSFSWQCKLCDFGSAIEGRIPLTSREDRQNAYDKIQKSTTSIFAVLRRTTHFFDCSRVRESFVKN